MIFQIPLYLRIVETEIVAQYSKDVMLFDLRVRYLDIINLTLPYMKCVEKVLIPLLMHFLIV